MDKIFIEHLAVRGKHGVSDEERSREQEFMLDIEIEFDTKAAAESDDLAGTVDYDSFRASAKEIAEGSSFHLIEKLADTIAQNILEDKRIAGVKISVRKSEMYSDCTPGVTIVRAQA